MSEKERSDLLKTIRSIVESGSSGFKWLSPPIAVPEAVSLRSCAAQFNLGRVSFGRWPWQEVLLDRPPILEWCLRCRAEGGRSAWDVSERVGKGALTAKGTFTTELGLAQGILEQLRAYCEWYEACAPRLDAWIAEYGS